MQRRRFIISSGGLFLGSQIPGIFSEVAMAMNSGGPKPQYILSPYRSKKKQDPYVDDKEHANERDGGVAVFDLSNGKTFMIPTPMVAHSLVAHPKEKHRILCVSQKPGTQSCEVDLKTRKVSKVFNSSKDVFFIGHASFSKDGEWVYFTEAQYGSAGFISRRKAGTYEIDKVYDSGGLEPHQLELAQDGQMLIVSNAGVKSKAHSMTPEDPANVKASLSFLDSKTGKVLSAQHDFEAQMSPRHLAIGERGQVFIGLRRFVKKDKEQMPLVMFESEKIQTFSAPDSVIQKMKSWLQSLAYSKSTGVLGASAPDGNCVTFWDTKNRKFIKAIDHLKVDGLTITPDEKYFVATAHTGSMIFIDAKSLEKIPGPWDQVSGLNWRHCLAITS